MNVIVHVTSIYSFLWQSSHCLQSSIDWVDDWCSGSLSNKTNIRDTDLWAKDINYYLINFSTGVYVN